MDTINTTFSRITQGYGVLLNGKGFEARVNSFAAWLSLGTAAIAAYTAYISSIYELAIYGSTATAAASLAYAWGASKLSKA